MFTDKQFLPQAARQFESVCGCETPTGSPGEFACWIEDDIAWLARLASSSQTLQFEPADGRGPPSVRLSARGIAAQMGCDRTGEFGAYLDVDGYVTIARPDGGVERLQDIEDSTEQRVQRRALFVLRDPFLAGPVGVFQAPRDDGGLDLYLACRDHMRLVYSQPAPTRAGEMQGLTATTPRPLSGATSATAPYRHLFVFGAPDERGNLQAWSFDVESATATQLTQSTDTLMAGIAYWRERQRWFACVGVDDRVSTAIRTYVEPADGVTPWERRETYEPPVSQLAAYGDPGAAQSPEISAPLATGEQLVTWSVHDRQGALTSFACGMNGTICAAILGRPESARVLTTLDFPVCEPEVTVSADGKTWWIVYERGTACVDDWSAWQSELRVIGPLTVADFG